MKLSSLVLVFANYYMRLCRNSYDISFVTRAITLLFVIFYLWDSISTSLLSSYISISNLTWNIVQSTIQAKFSRQTKTTNIACYFDIPYKDKLSQWKKLLVAMTTVMVTFIRVAAVTKWEFFWVAKEEKEKELR